MRHYHHEPHTSKSALFLAFVAGAAATAAAGGYWFFGSPEGRRHRDDAEEWVENAKEDVLARMRDARDLSEDTYRQIVDEVAEQYGNIKTIGKHKAQHMAQRLKRRYRHMSDALRETAEEAELEARAQELSEK